MTRAWGIVTRNNEILSSCVRATRSEAPSALLGLPMQDPYRLHHWEQYRKMGCRCIKVDVFAANGET